MSGVFILVSLCKDNKPFLIYKILVLVQWDCTSTNKTLKVKMSSL